MESIHRASHDIASKMCLIEDIPNEILGYIFKCYVDMDRSPWNLARVSNSWRVAAFTDPNLWAYIWLTDYTNHMSFYKYEFIKWSIKGCPRGAIETAGKWHVCLDEAMLLACLEKTKSAVLNIKVNNGSQFMSSLQLLLKQPLSSRIGRLEIELDGKSGRSALEEELGPFSSLEYLRIDSSNHPYWITNFIKSVQATAFKLTELSIGDWLTKDEKEVNSISPLLQRIQYLEMMDGNLIDMVLPHCGHLVTFKCSDPAWPRKYEVKGDILAGVQSISFYGPPEALSCLDLPSVRMLSVTDQFRPFILGWKPEHLVAPGEFNLPSLISLQAHCPSLMWLTQAHAPALSELDIDILTDSCQCNQEKALLRSDIASIALRRELVAIKRVPGLVLDPIGFLEAPEEDASSYPCILKPSLWSQLSNLSTLTLAAHCKEETFNMVIDVLPNIKSLHLIPRIGHRYRKNGLTILDHLVTISTVGSLPQMKIFKLGAWRDPIYLPKKIVNARVNSIIESRSANGMELLCFDVYWHIPMGKTKLEKYCL